MRKQKPILFWLILSSLLLYFSCRKMASEIPAPERSVSIERFFNLPGTVDAKLKAIAQSIKAQEKEKPFLNNFIKRAGWPVWDKSKIISPRNLSNGRSTNGDSSALVYIPFVQDSAIIVNAVLAVRLNPSDTAWRILYANNYETFGFDTTATDTWNARNIFQFFASFQYDIFGHTTFLIKDQRLFNTTGDPTIVTLKERNGVPVNGRTTEWHEVTECIALEICKSPPPAHARINSLPACIGDEVCNTYYWDDGIGPGGGTDWTGSSWSGNGSGGSSGGWGTSGMCADAPNGTPIACPPGWEPIINYVGTITNNITDLCLNEVYNKITESVYKNKLSQMLRDFQSSTQINITLITNNSLTSNIYGQAYSPGGDDNYLIEMHTDLLRRCSQEFIAATYFHEAIHVYLKSHLDEWNYLTSSGHVEMLTAYFDHLVSSVRDVFQGLSEKDALCMVLDCINNSDQDSDFNQTMLDSIKAALIFVIRTRYPDLNSESAIQAIADTYREGGTAGTRNANCN